MKRPDVVVALTDPPPVGLIGAFAAKLAAVPFVLVTKDIFPDVAVQLGVLDNPVAIGGLRAMKSALFENADRVVSIGRDMDRRLLELGVPAERDRDDPRLERRLGRGARSTRPSSLRTRSGGATGSW